jgi:putative nucleotide binding protein
MHWEPGEGRRPRFYGRKEIPDDTAAILDYLPQGNPFDRHPEHKRVPLAQAIGIKYFTLVELVVPEGEHFDVGEKIYIGSDYIGKGPIKSITGPIDYSELTSVSKSNLLTVLASIIKENEQVFVKIFNISGPITLRMHSLELLPGIGKRTLNIILDERKKSPFKSLTDLEERVALRGVKLHGVESIIAARIIKEMEGGERYYLFIKPKSSEREAVYLRLLDAIYAD